MKIPVYETRLVKVSHIEIPVRGVNTPEQVVSVLKALTDDIPGERIVVIFLNNRNRILGCEVVAKGGSDGAAIRPREIFQGALRANASAIILGHNHPSGDNSASYPDIAMTKTVARAGIMIGIPVLDHVIVTRDDGWSSLRELGILDDVNYQERGIENKEAA